MARNSRRKLLKSMGLDEEAMFGNHGSSKEEREFEAIIEKALKENRIPIECIEEVPISVDMAARVVIYREC